jgi:hypothetical protein
MIVKHEQKVKKFEGEKNPDFDKTTMKKNDIEMKKRYNVMMILKCY